MASIETNVRLIPELDGTEFIEATVTNHRFPLHLHDTFVIQYVDYGTDLCCLNEVAATSDEVFVHAPHAAHTGGTVADQRLRYRAIYPTVELVRELTGFAVAEIPQGQTSVVRNRRFTRQVRTLLGQCAGKSTSNSQSLRSGMRQVLEVALESSRSVSAADIPTQSIVEKLDLAREFLSDNFSRDVTTSELSSVCRVSEFHLIRSFRSRFGITPRQFLVSRRVAAAKKLIAHGMTATEAAYECGFADQSHLNRYFKKITGYSPGRLRDAKRSPGRVEKAASSR